MDNNTFNQVLERQLEAARSMLAKKAGEYALDDDRLHNFRVAAQLQEMTNAEALGGMLAKHVISVYDMIGKGDTTAFTQEQWDEKIGDAINYLILLQAVIHDDRSKLTVAAPAAVDPQVFARPIGDNNPENDAQYQNEHQKRWAAYEAYRSERLAAAEGFASFSEFKNHIYKAD